MSPEGQTHAGSSDIGDAIVAIRERWHTMKHPFFQAMKTGELPLRALGVYMAQHYRFVEYALPSFGYFYARAPIEVRKMVAENIAEEEGIVAMPGEDHQPHDHADMIFRFCAAAGLTADEVRTIRRTPAWWGRTLHYFNTAREEPIGVVLAMQSTQEGQQVALNTQITLPAFETHYGFPKGSPEIDFFAEHAEADLEHSRRQLELCVKYIDTEELARRALEVSEEACRLRWASITDLWRSEVKGEPDPLPPGVTE